MDLFFLSVSVNFRKKSQIFTKKMTPFDLFYCVSLSKVIWVSEKKTKSDREFRLV